MSDISKAIKALVAKISPGKPLTIIEADKLELRLCLTHDSHWHVYYRSVDQDLGDSLDLLLFNYVIIGQKVIAYPDDHDISIFGNRVHHYVRENRSLLIKELVQVLEKFYTASS